MGNDWQFYDVIQCDSINLLALSNIFGFIQLTSIWRVKKTLQFGCENRKFCIQWIFYVWAKVAPIWRGAKGNGNVKADEKDAKV